MLFHENSFFVTTVAGPAGGMGKIRGVGAASVVKTGGGGMKGPFTPSLNVSGATVGPQDLGNPFVTLKKPVIGR